MTAYDDTEVVTKDIRDVVQNYKNTVNKVNILFVVPISLHPGI